MCVTNYASDWDLSSARAITVSMLALTSVALLMIGRRTWLATEHLMRVRGTLGQH